jgi:peptidoglycan/LPS O-acetylase OafA/YrhL
MSHPRSPLAALPALDGVRGIAIALVLVHTSNILQDWADPVGHVLLRMANLGWMGVQLFFVLSGFLITRNLLQMQGTTGYFQAFYGRRILRIFPLYYATLLFFFAVLPLLKHVPQAIQDDIPHQMWLWFFLSNWTQQLGLGGSSLPHFWSLAVEEQFYLLWPLVVYRRTSKQLLQICGAIVVVSLLARCVMVLSGAAPLLIYTSSICRMDALAMGAALAVWLQLPDSLNRLIEYRFRLLWAAAGLMLTGWLVSKGFGMTDPMGQTLGYSLLALVFTILIARAVAGENLPISFGQSLLCSKPLRALGKYSFAMYVFHAPLNSYVGMVWLEQLGWRQHPTTLQGLVYVIALSMGAFLLAWLSFHLLEKHFLRLKRFFVVTGPKLR